MTTKPKHECPQCQSTAPLTEDGLCPDCRCNEATRKALTVPDKPKHTPTPLDNVCIIQKYNDSERVLECREEFKKSEKYIVTAVNNHERMKEALKGQHKAIDWLLAALIQKDPTFLPTKSPIWKYLVAGSDLLAGLERG